MNINQTPICDSISGISSHNSPMAENGEKSEVRDSPSVPASYLEVSCRSSSKIRRFSSGTEAGFALNLINRKLDEGLPQALYIEAVKEEEEPISFGPNSVLVSYGHGWKLRTVTETEGGPRARTRTRRTSNRESSSPGFDDMQSTKGLLPSVIANTSGSSSFTRQTQSS
ncbi:unnamed protein product [Lactuca virosa]|uniref:Uncharacterized protein n=1 Tax=Lactuca virosa TaxID=75947 RepID=A0AAU9NVR6_9ASTR|nr:unnamed protein product [Lactuca virosa]